MHRLQSRLSPLSEALADIAKAEEDCRAANVDENDYTVFTLQDLEFEHGLVVQSISKKIVFIDNQACSISHTHFFMLILHTFQIVSRNMTNLTPAQLEQFETTFRYFDRDESNTLEVSEMAAALASLGIIYSVRSLNLRVACG